MLTIFVRTVIIYILLIGTMRLMGKRQLGELEISELVTTLFLSEIASLPISNQTIPLVFVIIPLVTILAMELFLSVLLVKFPKLKGIAATRPSVLIRKGKVDQKELLRVRLALDELISEVRQAGYAHLDEVYYAILEQNGKISIIPRKGAQPPTADDLGKTFPETGIVHILIESGKINEYNLGQMHLSKETVEEELARRRLTAEDVFFLGMDDGGKYYVIEKEEQS